MREWWHGCWENDEEDPIEISLIGDESIVLHSKRETQVHTSHAWEKRDLKLESVSHPSRVHSNNVANCSKDKVKNWLMLKD